MIITKVKLYYQYVNHYFAFGHDAVFPLNVPPKPGRRRVTWLGPNTMTLQLRKSNSTLST